MDFYVLKGGSMSAITLREMTHEIYVKEHPAALGPLSQVSQPLAVIQPHARMIAYSRLSWIYPEYLKEYPHTKRLELIYGRYGVAQERLMTVEQLEDLYQFFRNVLLTVPRRKS